ncbi:hypothetical protein SPPR111872_18300 [Sphingobacterium prati]
MKYRFTVLLLVIMMMSQLPVFGVAKQVYYQLKDTIMKRINRRNALTNISNMLIYRHYTN